MRVAVALMEDPDTRHWGYDLSRAAGIRSGVLYPILHRLLEEGWLEDGWEDPTTTTRKRPPRRYYELTDKGRAALGGMVEHARADVRFSELFGGVALDA
jgi:PadR family transcriptional regulator, regulatory protein PadR